MEQTSAYLDHHSALDYMAMTRASAVTMAHQAKIPLHDIARAIIANSAGVGLNVIVLGAGNGVLETKLVQDLIANAAQSGCRSVPARYQSAAA